MSGDYDQTDPVSHGCFQRHCSKGQHLPRARISVVCVCVCVQLAQCSHGLPCEGPGFNSLSERIDRAFRPSQETVNGGAVYK